MKLIPMQTRRNRRSAAEAERRRLAAELADYTTQAQVNDLNALLDSYPDDEVAEIRDLLNRNVAV